MVIAWSGLRTTQGRPGHIVYGSNTNPHSGTSPRFALLVPLHISHVIAKKARSHGWVKTALTFSASAIGASPLSVWGRVGGVKSRDAI